LLAGARSAPDKQKTAFQRPIILLIKSTNTLKLEHSQTKERTRYYTDGAFAVKPPLHYSITGQGSLEKRNVEFPRNKQ
jgi:hypothetical protein